MSERWWKRLFSPGSKRWESTISRDYEQIQEMLTRGKRAPAAPSARSRPAFDVVGTSLPPTPLTPLEAYWRDVVTRVVAQGFGSLGPEEKTWVRVRDLIESTKNGGLISYFYNSHADHYEECIQDLHVLGADEVIASVERVARLFGSTVPKDIGERNAVINSFTDEVEAQAELEQELGEIDHRLVGLFPALEQRLEQYVEAWLESAGGRS